MQWKTWVIHVRSLSHCRTREWCPVLPACVFQRAGYNEDDCGGVTIGPVVWLPGINNKQHMEEWLYSPWSPKTDLWCRDSSSLHPCRSPSDRLPRSPHCSPCDWWIKSVSVGSLGGKKRKTSERIHSVSFSYKKHRSWYSHGCEKAYLGQAWDSHLHIYHER